MGAALEAGKSLRLAEHWHTAALLPRFVLVAMVDVLTGLNAVGVFGFLTRAHLEHAVAIDLALAGRTADIEMRLAIQGQTVAELDRRIAQIDAAIEQSTRLVRLGPSGRCDDHCRPEASRSRRPRRCAPARGSGARQLQVKKDRRGSGAPKPDVGPLRYLAELIGTSTADLERPVRLLTLVLVAVLDPMAVALLLAAGTQAPRASSH